MRHRFALHIKSCAEADGEKKHTHICKRYLWSPDSDRLFPVLEVIFLHPIVSSEPFVRVVFFCCRCAETKLSPP